MFFNKRVPSWLREAYYYDSLGGIFYGIFFGMSIAFFPIILRKMGAVDFQVAAITSFPFVGALFAIFWAHHSSRRPKMAFVVRFKTIARCILLFTLFAYNPAIFVLIVLLYWIFELGASPAYTGIMQDIYPEEHRGKAMGYVRVEMALAAIGITYLTGFLLDKISFRYVFPVGALFGLVYLLFFSRIKVGSDKLVPRDNNKESFSFRSTINLLRRDKHFLYYVVIFFVFGFGNIMSLPLYTFFLVDKLHITNAMAGKLAALYSFFWLFSYMFWGEYIDRKHPLKALCALIIISSAIPLCYFFARDFKLIALASALSGLTFGGTELSRLAYITKIAGKKEVQRYWGIDFTLMGLRGVLAPFLGIGLMYLIGIKGVFAISFVLIFLSGLFMTLFYRRHKTTALSTRPPA